MQAKAKISYNAGKLASNLPKIIQKHMQRYARSSEKGSKEAIDKGILIEPLDEQGFKMGGKIKGIKNITRIVRHNKGITGTKPLYETGNLHRSIKSKDGKLTMLHYGILHHRGFTTSPKSMFPNKKVPARPFIGASKKEILSVFDAFKKDIRRNFRK
jgi:phage gpG-like protein